MKDQATVVISIRSFLTDRPMSDSELLTLLIDFIKRPYSGFEISWGPEDIFRMDQPEMDRIAFLLDRYAYNTLHCGSYGDFAFGRDQKLMEKFYKSVDFFGSRGLIQSVSIHANDIGDFDIPSRLSPGIECLLEVMGNFNNSHNTFKEIEAIIKMDKGWGITLDTAHVYEMSLIGEPDLQYYLNFFSEKIRHIHLSSHTNPYKAYQEFAKFETQHALLSLCPEFKSYIEQFLPQLRRYPITLEGIVPDKLIFRDAFYKDLSLLEPILS